MRDETAALLGWYDLHARELPWRVSPSDRRAGVVPDPYRVWLSEIMLQQTTVAAVRAYYERFTHLWPDVCALAAAEDGEVMAAWAGLGYYARARNLLACARVVSDRFGGRFPDSEETLRTLPGIGPYTAAAIAAIAFERPATVVDGNVERVVARLRAVETPLPDAKALLAALAAELTPVARPGDHAQAMMDLGATVCTPRSPACGICPVMASCEARLQGIAADLPRKRRKAPKPVRHGLLWVGQRDDGLWLVERRPDRGLLGGMLGWPGSAWSEAAVEARPDLPPAAGAWASIGEVRHTFTHFHLVLDVRAARLAHDTAADRGEFLPLNPRHLPTVMRKAHALAAPALRQSFPSAS